ncbi:hypothetical protein FNYG_02736 [Fusarium nygamai]|uniref:F-box domain-containing protein n=1 Tax=Gibberella nygamai TaxID=42673 RepID=A0A2K0WP54_GIBNY|nr:hypothetical protein FNYG_02736 [Fusarium nygamai]
MEIARPPKSLRADRFERNIQALRIIAQQRPDDPEAQRRAQVATDLYLQTWPHHTLPTPVTTYNPAKSRRKSRKKSRRTGSIPSLPNEIYEMIFGYILAEYPTNNRERLFDACPNVTRFSLNASASDSNDSVAFQTNKQFFKFWNQLTHVEGLRCSESEDIISISKRCPSLQRLKIDCFGRLDPGTLLDASQIWGKTLRTLNLDWLEMPSETTIAQLLEHLPKIEEVFLGHLHDILPSIHALAHLSLPQLKRLRVASYRKWNTDHSQEEDAAICGMITAHADTLESLSLTCLYVLSRSVLEAIKKAKKLEFLNLEVLRVLTDEEREELQAACPKLRIFVNFLADTPRKVCTENSTGPI